MAAEVHAFVDSSVVPTNHYRMESVIAGNHAQEKKLKREALDSLLDPVDQQLLDDCGSCLADSAYRGVCEDCAFPGEGIVSCAGIMESYVGVLCGF